MDFTFILVLATLITGILSLVKLNQSIFIHIREFSASIFPILFVYASKNLDAKGVFEWMMEKPNDWIGKK